MDIVWDNMTRLDALNDDVAQARIALADAAKSADSPTVFELLSRHGKWVNASRPGGKSQFAPLHQAAYTGAPVDMGVFRTRAKRARGTPSRRSRTKKSPPTTRNMEASAEALNSCRNTFENPVAFSRSDP